MPLAIAMILLSGCAATSSSPSVCPKIVPYGPAFQDRLVTEIQALPVGSALEAALIDYSSLRAQLRACQ